MSKVDDELSRRLHRAERQVDADDLFEGLARLRRRRRTLQRLQAGALAVVVVGATVIGFVALSTAFRDDPAAGPGRNAGRIVFGRVQLELAPDGSSSSHGFEIWSMASDGSDLQPVYSGGGSATTPAWSPDGSRVAFLDEDPDAEGLGNLRLLSSEADGSDLTVITEGLIEPIVPTVAWSPDGTKIAVLDTEEHDLDSLDEFGLPLTEIAVFTLDGTRERLVDTPGTAGGFTWSPDGQGFTVTRMDEDGGIDLVRVDLDGRVIGLLAEDVSLQSPAWSPDGSRVAFIREDPPTGESDVPVRDVWTVDPDGTDEERVTRDGTRKTSLDWTADGARIIYTVQSPDRCDIVSIRPDGSDRTLVADRSTMGGCAQEIDSHPAVLSPIPPGPTTSPSPDLESEAGRDIGLGYNVCNLKRLDGIDFLGDGTRGQAWTGSRVKDDGRCPNVEAPALVAADLDGDGRADTSSATIEWCFFCEPFDATDLDADGDEELIVLWSGGSTPAFMVYAITDGEIAPVLLAEPGHPEARAEPGVPLTFATGGDEGYAGWVRCENFPAAPVLVVTWRDHPVEGDTMEVHETRFVLEDDGRFHVVDTNDYRAPVGEPIPGVSDEPACGVDFQLFG